MALGFNTKMNDGAESSEFMPIIKYQAEAGRLYRIDRMGGSSGFESVPTELSTGTKMVLDFGGISVGWLLFSAGMAPSFALVPLGSTMPARPSKDHKQGFKMLVHLGKSGGVREFATSSKTVTGAIDDLHGQFEAAPEAHAGKVPVVEFGGADMIVSKNVHGSKTLYRPKFRIVGWVDRPSDLGPRTVPPPGRAAQHAQPAQAARPTNGSTNPRHVPPPQQAPQASVDEWNTSLAAASQAHAAPPGKDQWGGGGSDINDEIPFAACWQ